MKVKFVFTAALNIVNNELVGKALYHPVGKCKLA